MKRKILLFLIIIIAFVTSVNNSSIHISQTLVSDFTREMMYEKDKPLYKVGEKKLNELLNGLKKGYGYLAQAYLFACLSVGPYSSSEKKEIIKAAKELGLAEEDYKPSKEQLKSLIDKPNYSLDQIICSDGNRLSGAKSTPTKGDYLLASTNIADFDFTPSGYKSNPKFKVYKCYLEYDPDTGVLSIHRGVETKDWDNTYIFSCKHNYEIAKDMSESETSNTIGTGTFWGGSTVQEIYEAVINATPTKEPTPTVTPAPKPTEEAKPTPKPTPSITPTPERTKEPTPTVEPTKAPETTPTATPEPTPAEATPTPDEPEVVPTPEPDNPEPKPEIPYEEVIVKEPTCNEDGVKRFVNPDDETDFYEESVPKLEHDWHMTEQTPATCTEKGHEVWKCSRCGETKDLELDLVEHQMEETERVDATCTEDGYITYTCKVCGKTETTVIGKRGHKEVKEVVVEPSAFSEGREVTKCSVCGEILSEEVLPATFPLPIWVLVAIGVVLIGGITATVVVKKKKG